MYKLEDKLLIVFVDEPLNETIEELAEQTVVIKQHNLLNYSVWKHLRETFTCSTNGDLVSTRRLIEMLALCLIYLDNQRAKK